MSQTKAALVKGFSLSSSAPDGSVNLDSSGRLLVGTSSSAQGTCRLLIQGNANGATNAGGLFITRGDSTPADGVNIGVINFADSGHVPAASITAVRDGGTWTSGSSQPTLLRFSTTADGASSPTERMRIDKNGNTLCCGATVTNPGVGNTNTGFVIENAADGATLLASRGSNATVYLNRNSDGTIQEMRRSGSTVGTIGVTSTSTSYNTSSDYRLKENISLVSDGITRLQQLKPSRFNFIANPGQTVDGFIAHEVQAVVPEAITGEKDAVDADGNPIYQGIDQSKLVPLLTAALQEAIGEIESLKARVAALEA